MASLINHVASRRLIASGHAFVSQSHSLFQCVGVIWRLYILAIFPPQKIGYFAAPPPPGKMAI